MSTHTHAHTCAHTHTHAHTRTHTHTRTPNNTNLPFLFLTDIPPCWGHTVLYVGRSVTVHGDPSVITVPLSAQVWIQLAAPRGFWLGTSQEVAIRGSARPAGDGGATSARAHSQGSHAGDVGGAVLSQGLHAAA